MIERTYIHDGVKFRVFEDDIHAVGSKGEKWAKRNERELYTLFP